MINLNHIVRGNLKALIRSYVAQYRSGSNRKGKRRNYNESTKKTNRSAVCLFENSAETFGNTIERILKLSRLSNHLGASTNSASKTMPYES
jgi:hypothetical protein